MKTHPDKFEHVDKGTQTEVAILDKFREIQSAYEIVELELEKLKINS
jgi:curved DNA-binding protein CbpA